MSGPIVTSEQERWAFADRLMEIHGDDVGVYIADRLTRLADAGDRDGQRFWIDISSKVVSLAGPEENGWLH